MARIVPDDRARQGPPGRPVLGVLIGALILCGIAAGGWFLWAVYSAPASPRQPSPTASATDVIPPSSPANPTTKVPATNPAYPVPVEPRATGTTNPQ